WKVLSVESDPGRGGIEHRHVAVDETAAGGRVDVHFAIFSAKSCTLRVIDNPEGEKLGSVITSENCLCSVNGRYSDADFKLIGLRIVNGQTIAPLRRARLITGVLLASSRDRK